MTLLNQSEPVTPAYLLPLSESLRPDPHFVEGHFCIGRDCANNLSLFDPYIGPHHCRIEKRPHGYFIKDLSSENGTYVDGLLVIEAKLSHGSVIKIGKLEFLFQIGDNLKHKKLRGFSSKNRVWMAQLESLCDISNSSLPVFIQGESGCGKEVVANKIHNISPRSKEPFVGVNCGALHESLVESELFGHIKGAFTGATTDRKGAFEAARGGTLFLDEIGDLPLNLQSKLLRALESNEIRPVGSDKVIKTDVRIITATHKNLEEMVKTDLFRSDLYFRMHVIRISIPPLRERMEDFEDLVHTFCKEYKVGFSKTAINDLKKHQWPGNIRELKNIIAKASVVFPKKYIEPQHVDYLMKENTFLTPDTQSSSSVNQRISTMPFIKEFEKEVIRASLIANNGNQRKTAVELGMAKSTLHDRIKAYNIDVKSLAHLKGIKVDLFNPSIV
ncbi:MAG: sigma 54-interacting transcriptional regulator [Oligoflexia bacterium]|nr:sigma 54-interacting transcriptional regulator [Oligoflexia bacterium]